MECPKCGTWNPDDRQTCWRCGAVLPKPQTKKKRSQITFMNLPLWVWGLLIAMFLFWILGRLFF